MLSFQPQSALQYPDAKNSFNLKEPSENFGQNNPMSFGGSALEAKMGLTNRESLNN